MMNIYYQRNWALGAVVAMCLFFCTAGNLMAQEIATYTGMRKLWSDHMQWTYTTVDSFFNNETALQPSLDRLLKNQQDIGDAIVPFYGQSAGDGLAALLTEHIELAIPVLSAAQSGNQPALQTAIDDWHVNAEEIADFLTAANPVNWPSSDMRPMMAHHIDTTVTYAVDLLNRDYQQAIVDLDHAYDHMTEMSDVLSEGLVGNTMPNIIATYTGMRKLWSDHMQWTYATVDSFFNNETALQPSLDRLLKNQQDIGDAIAPFYGQSAGDGLAALLTEHIELAIPVLSAAQSGDQPALQMAIDDWHVNAEEIADFLTTADPVNWPSSEMRPMMEHHIDTTVTYAVDLLNRDYQQAIVDLDHAYEHMTEMSDVLAEGLVFIPEPSTAALGGLAIMGLVVTRRSKVRVG